MQQAQVVIVDAKKVRIGVLSDSHGLEVFVKKALDKMGAVDLVIFLGDGYNDIKHCMLLLQSVPLYAVQGNNDFCTQLATELCIDVAGTRLFCTHGHQYHVSFDTDRLFNRARTLGANAALYGHTHMANIAYNQDVLLLNPGSVGLPRGGKSSALLLSIAGGEIDVQKVEI